MKRFIFLAVLASGFGTIWVADCRSDTPLSLGRQRRVGRIQGYWFQPTRGPLFDYSPYFAARYPQLPGAAEFQWPQPQFGPAASQIVVDQAPTATKSPAQRSDSADSEKRDK